MGLLESSSNNSKGEFYSSFRGLGSLQQKSLVSFIFLCFQLLIYYFLGFYFEGFSIYFERYADSSFSFRLFFCLALRFSPDDDGIV